MTTVEITTTDLIDIFSKMNGSPFISFVSLTEVTMNKTNNPYFGRVTKLRKVKIKSGYDYQKSVNTQLEKEGKDPSFVEGCFWGKLLDPNNKYVITDKKTETKFYLRYKIEEKLKTIYFLDGKEIDKDTILPLIKPFMKDGNKYKNQGVDKVIEHQVVKFENIKEVRMNKVDYIIQ